VLSDQLDDVLNDPSSIYPGVNKENEVDEK